MHVLFVHQNFPAQFRHIAPRFRQDVEVIPEGIDTDLWRRDATADRRLPDGTIVPAATRIVTYVARGFELMRGSDVFMRAAKRIYQQYPEVLFVVAGTDKAYYGGDAQYTGGKTLREHVLASDDYDLSRFHFTGWLSEHELARVLSLSDLHVYLTEPFVTSWSMLDAMSCGCVVQVSDQACTREYIRHGENGLLCNFFDVEAIARTALNVLSDPAAHRRLGESARRTIEERYALDVTLPRIKAFFEQVVAKGRQRPSVLARNLIRPGVFKGKDKARAAKEQAKKEAAPVAAPPAPLSDAMRSASPKTILFCWELGGGLGHMMQILPLTRSLVRRGHRVFVALRHLSDAEGVFATSDVCYLQAPYQAEVPPADRPFPITRSFAHILANVGWHNERKLFALACGWQNLFAMVKPDAVVFDHSPTALLAARGLPKRVPRVLIGSGFCCPPDAFPLPALTRVADAARLAADEQRILRRVNHLLGHWDLPPLARLAQLYARPAENFLTTFPELEQYPGRAGARYWGPVVGTTDAKAPEWPAAEGPRIFAYLKRFEGLADVLKVIGAKGCPTVVYVDGLDAKARGSLAAPTLRLERRRVDLARAARECDLAVLHAGQGSTAQVLLAGKPVLQLPLVLEQQLTARAVARLGAGQAAPPKNAEAVREKLDAMLATDRYAAAAKVFAAKYADFDPEAQVRRMAARVEELLGDAAGASMRRAAPTAAHHAAVPAVVFCS